MTLMSFGRTIHTHHGTHHSLPTPGVSRGRSLSMEQLFHVSQCVNINTISQTLKEYSHYQHGRGCGGVFSNGTAMPE